MKVTLYAIAKNEEKNIEKFLKNAEKFDDVVVVDTGSTDNTVQLLKDAGIKVYEHPQTRAEFDFSVARNQALSYVETDWAFSLDFNEDVDEFHPEGFGVIADEFTTFNHLRFDDNGTDEPVQSNEVHIRFHRTKNYTWVNAVHEVPNFVPTEEYPNASAVDTTIKITKKIHKSVDKELFYFSICEREHKKDPSNWYWIWFIFNHYFNVQNTEKALEYGQEFLNVSKPYFDSFRIIALSQLSRKVEERADKLPMLSDLRESGSIEQDADIVIMLMRPSYYEMKEPVEIGGKEYHPDDLVIVKVEKNRHGKTGNIPIRFIGETTTFEDYKH